MGAAEQLFVEQGFDETTIEAILRKAGVSRGALYHHFASKRDVFEAVFVATSGCLVKSSGRGKAAISPLVQLEKASCRWLRAVGDPVCGAVLLELGPRVLGWKRARDLESENTLKPVVRILQGAREHGEIAGSNQDLELWGRLLSGLLTEGALLIREGQASRSRVEREVVRWLESLRTE